VPASLQRAPGLQEGGGPSPGDFFQQMFGGAFGFGGGRERERRGKDVVHQLKVGPGVALARAGRTLC